MEFLQSDHPFRPDQTHNPLHGLSSPASFERTTRFVSPEVAEESDRSIAVGERVYVAVGKSVGKTLSLLQWSFRQFGGTEICLLHVHQPSPLIPTLLGKLPANQANDEVVSAHRKEEKEKTKKLLDDYLSACATIKLKASILVTEADQVHKGILELVNRISIKKLVIGAEPENCLKMKRSSKMATFASKKAPAFCQIWFVNKGKPVWVREASENPSSVPSATRSRTLNLESRSRSFQHSKSSSSFRLENLPSRSHTALVSDETTVQDDVNRINLESTSCSNSAAESRLSSDSDVNVDEDRLIGRLAEARTRVMESNSRARLELLRCKELEQAAIEAISKVKVFESARDREVKLREEAENELRATIHEQEKLLEEKEELTRELHKTMRNVALLDSCAQTSNRRREEASEEFRLVETSIAALRLEKQRIRRHKVEAVRWLDRWRSHGQFGATNCNEFVEFSSGDLPELAEFSLAELETATCDFSESFKIGQGCNGCVYKGELMGKTVAIKKLHPYNMQGQAEFQQEVRVLSKLQHAHLVTFLGYCPEAWSLVYAYLPNGSLHDRLFRKTNVSPLPWKTRTKIVSEICSALCFLHSSKPQKIVHGDLKPENILLDSDLTCKICDFGICRIVTEEALNRPYFRCNTEPKGAFPYTDPEFYRFGVLTPKSDVYSFGIIILQLLTGKPPVGLVAEVRKAVSLGKLVSVLDSSAGEWPVFVAKRLVDIGLQCCESYGRDRPDLTPSLVKELEQLHASEERPAPSFFLCPIFKEIMHDPQIAADGFTYEGEAIREWLGNGHETSPMTNLKLSHLHLTPNHGLRLAIQDWLCRS